MKMTKRWSDSLLKINLQNVKLSNQDRALYPQNFLFFLFTVGYPAKAGTAVGSASFSWTAVTASLTAVPALAG